MKTKVKSIRRWFRFNINPYSWILSLSIGGDGIKIRISKLYIGIFVKEYIFPDDINW